MKIQRARPATLSHYEALVLVALRQVVQGLDDALDMSLLAAPACMAPLHFHRVFKGLVGESPLQLQRRLRLERAAWQLAHGTQGVLPLALAAGYDTHEAFSRSFRSAFGRTPSEHRAQARAAPGRTVTLSHHIQAACSLHVEGLQVPLPDDLRTLLQHHGVLTMDVLIDVCPALRVAALPHVGPYNTIGEAFSRLGERAGAAGLLSRDAPPEMVAIYYDDVDTVPADRLRSAAGLIVPEVVELPPGLDAVRLPSGRWASVLHRGPYSGLGDAWERFVGQWLPASGQRLRSAECYERYLNDPGTVEPQQLQTRLFLPLED